MAGERSIAWLTDRLVEAWAQDRIDDVPLSEADAERIVAALHANLDHWIDARDHAAAAQSLTLACEPGCAGCCRNLIMVFRGESLAVAAWLSRDENRDARDAFLANYPHWRAAVGDAPERASDARRRRDEAGFERACMEVWRRGVMCALNRDGLCLAYPARPSTCRHCHALDTNQHCQPGSQRPPDTLEVEQIQRFRSETRPLNEAVHEALGGEPGVLVALCEDVFRLLTQ